MKGVALDIIHSFPRHITGIYFVGYKHENNYIEHKMSQSCSIHCGVGSHCEDDFIASGWAV